MTKKEEIRSSVKTIVSSFSQTEIERKSFAINSLLLSLECIANATSIALYYSTPYEAQTIDLIATFLKEKKEVYLPKTLKNRIEFRRITSFDQLIAGPYSILEPQNTCPSTDYNTIDCIIVPCIAIDKKGNRLGHGKGFYDKFLSHITTPTTIALVFNEQIIDQVPSAPHDIPIDIIISEEAPVFCSKQKNKIIDGKKIAQQVITLIKKTVKKDSIKATLAVIQVGNNPASTLYVAMKKKACEQAGIAVKFLHFIEKTTQQEVEQSISQLNSDSHITGILVQLPLPPHLHSDAIINLIDPIKDIDGLTSINRRRLEQGEETLACCTPKGIIKLLELSNIPLENKKICLIGNGFLVGNPLACMLTNRKISFILCDKKTSDIKEKTRSADIIITATGAPYLIDQNYINHGAIIIDAGSAKLNNKVVGDVNIEEVIDKVEKITPVPGGVGPMTIATLLENILESYNLQKKISFAMSKSFFSKIAIITSETSWFAPHARKFEQSLNDHHLNAKLFFNYENIDNNPEVVFILSYFSIIKPHLLQRYKHNLVIHESSLPQGKGWAPLFWQILEGKNNIPIVLFEAVKDIDAGPVYLRDTIVLEGNELHDEIREIQAQKTIELCYNFLFNYESITPQQQKGPESFYQKRTPRHSELDSNKPLKELFNQLRIASNEDYPAFFYYNGEKYILKISKENYD